MNPILFLLAAGALAVGWEAPASAYIDPATSGILMQILAPILIALGVLRRQIALFVRLIIARLREGIRRNGG